jgi:hypothetical protein
MAQESACHASTSNNTLLPRRPNQPLDTRWTRGRQQIIDLGFPLADADKAGLGTPVLGSTHRRQTGEPLLTFLLADGQLRAPSALAPVGRVTGPALLGQQPQGEALGRERQGTMDEQALTGSRAQGPQAPRRRVARPVDFGRILDRQPHRDVVLAATGRRDRAVQDVARLDGVVRKEAIGGCEQGVLATGCGQGRGGMLGQDASAFDQACGAPHIAQCGIGKLAHGPVRVIGLAPQAGLLCHQVARGGAGRHHGPGIPEELLK